MSSVLRACAGAIVVGVVTLAPPPATANGTPTPQDGLCEAARDHLADDRPHRAVEIVVAAREATGQPSLCIDEAFAAARAGRISANALARASLEADEASPDWDYVRRNAEAALAADADNDDARTLVAEAATHLSGTPLIDAGREESGWSEFRDDSLEPLGRLALAGLGIAAGLLVLARLVVLLWPTAVPRTTRGGRAAAATTGAVGLLAAVASPLWLATASAAALALTVLVLLGTVLCVALAMASRLRIAVEVRRADGSSDEATSAAVVAALRSLGAEPPRGLELPEGTDVGALADAGITVVRARRLPELRSLLGLTPWRVTVHEGAEGSGDLRVVVQRNGRTAGAASLETAPLGAGGPTVDPRTMAAAFVLDVLARGYSSGFEALGSIADWQALGFTVAASRATDPASRRALLAAAVARDPGNLMAQVAMRHDRDRSTSDQRRLDQYVRWLVERADELDAEGLRPRRLEPLQARMLLTATAVELNRLAHQQPAARRLRGAAPEATEPRTAPAPGGPRADAQRHALELVRLLSGRSLDARFTARLRPVAAVLTLAAFGAAARTAPGFDPALDLDVLPDHPELERDQARALHTARRWYSAVEGDPDARFAEACRLVELARPGTDRRLVSRALELLAEEVQRPGGRARITQDPCLAPLVVSGRFRKRHPAPPRSRMVELEPFSRHADELLRLGLDTPSDLWEATEDPATAAGLADHLRVLPSTVRQLGEAAALAADVPDHLASHRFEVFDALWRCGVRSPDDLRALSPAVLADAVKDAAAERGLWYSTEPDEDPVLRDWFVSHGASSARVPAQRSGQGNDRSSTRRP